MSSKFLLCIFTCKCRGGEGKERRSGEGGREEEELEGFDAMQTGSLLKHAARSSPHTTKTRALVCQLWRNLTARKDSL